MATYYVRKGGNDGGTGATGDPWLTVHKGISTMAAGDTLYIGDGDYLEDSGSGYLFISKTFTTATVTIRGESGNAAAVTITGASGTSYCTMIQVASTSRLVFEDLTFYMRVKENNSGALRIARAVNPLTFNRCIFTGLTDPASASRAALYISNAASGVSNVDFNNCSFAMVGADPGYAVWFNKGAGAIDAITFTDCTASAVTYAFRAVGGSNISIIRGSYTNTGAGAAIVYGVDGDTNTYTASGTITGAAIQSPASHSLLIGAGCDGVTAQNNTIIGGDYGVVVKSCVNVTVQNNTITGGTSGSLYFKGSTASSATGNTISNGVGGACISASQNASAVKVQNITITGNKVKASGASSIFNWGGDADDAGGCVIDKNVYSPKSATKFGVVRADAHVLSLAELRAAWAGYGDGSNDGGSRLKGSAGFRLL
jgi:parallel beta-helix repeat protein